MNLTNKTIVVTGGNGALGRAVAHRAQSLGARVVVLDAREAKNNLGTEQIVVDLTNADAVTQTFARLGKVDAVCNIAGGFAMGTPAHAGDDTQWEAMFRLNVATVRSVIKAVVPSMLAHKAGRIINVGAASALHGKAGMSAYTASKAAVMNLTESLAAELADTPIRVNAILPTMIDTPTNRADMPDADFSQWVSPDDIAQVVCFLASDASRALHGALIPVAGAQGDL